MSKTNDQIEIDLYKTKGSYYLSITKYADTLEQSKIAVLKITKQQADTTAILLRIPVQSTPAVKTKADKKQTNIFNNE
jgi:hypothetical protein